MANLTARPGITETTERVRLAGGPLDYTLRRSPRARTLRVLIHPDRGVVVTIPATARRVLLVVIR